MKRENKILIVVEEIANLDSSASIVNWHLSKIIGEGFSNVDILTLDSISTPLKKEWIYGSIYTHPKENIAPFQKFLKKIPKLLGVLSILLGNDFPHYNRVKSIKRFLKKNKRNYNHLILLSGGLGFTPHHSISGKLDIPTIGVYHDPYPLSSYPEPYKGGNRFIDFTRKRNQQKSFNYLTHLVFPSQRLYEWYAKDYTIDPNKVTIVPHAVGTASEEHQGDELKNSNTILHIGTLLKPRNPKTFIEEFVKLESNFKLEFFGSINQHVYSSIKSFNGQNGVFISNGRIPYQDAIIKMRNSSFLLLIESDGINPFLPTKFVDYVNMNKPLIVLTNSYSEISRLLSENYPFKTDLNNSIGISNILNAKLQDEAQLLKAKEILQSLRTYFSSENILRSYRKMINNE